MRENRQAVKSSAIARRDKVMRREGPGYRQAPGDGRLGYCSYQGQSSAVQTSSEGRSGNGAWTSLGRASSEDVKQYSCTSRLERRYLNGTLRGCNRKWPQQLFGLC